MSVLRRLDPADKRDYQILRSLGMTTLQSQWKDIREYLEEELHRIDVLNRTAPPIRNTRLGAQAEMLQDVLDKFDKALEAIGEGRVG